MPLGATRLTRSPSHGAVENRPAGMDIYITSEGGSARRLAATNAHERCPAFSPDGQRLAYLELPMSGASLAPSLVVVRVNAADDSSSPELRVPVPASEVYGLRSFAVPCPQWSPDGSRLAYLAYPTGPQPGTGGVLELLAELRVVTLDGDERVVDSGRPAHPGPFAWSPDGDAIAYAAADGVWAAPLDGSAPSLVWRTEGTPTAVSWSSRGELAVTVLTMVAVEGGSQDVFSVHIVDVDGGRRAAARREPPVRIRACVVARWIAARVSG